MEVYSLRLGLNVSRDINIETAMGNRKLRFLDAIFLLWLTHHYIGEDERVLSVLLKKWMFGDKLQHIVLV